MMKTTSGLLAVLTVATACGGGGQATPIELEPLFAAHPGGTLAFAEKRGALILAGKKLSKDNGRTAVSVNEPQLGTYVEGWILSDTEVLIRTTGYGLSMWSMTDDLVRPLANQPPDSQVFAVQVHRPTRTLYLNDHTNRRVHRWKDGAWTVLPQEARPDGTTGTHPGLRYGFVLAGERLWSWTNERLQYLDAGAAAWTTVTDPVPEDFIQQGRRQELAPLPDGRLVLSISRDESSHDRTGDNILYIVGPAAAATQRVRPEPTDGLTVCPDGAWLNGGSVSTDEGATWTQVVSFPGASTSNRLGATFCTDTYRGWEVSWGLGVTARVMSLFTSTSGGPPRFLSDVWPAFLTPNPVSSVGAGGTLSADGLSFVVEGTPGARFDVAEGKWEAISLEARPRAIGGDEFIAFSGDGQTRYLSNDGGRTWTSANATAVPYFDRVLRRRDGSLLATRYEEGTDGFDEVTRSRLYRSVDEGSHWELRTDAKAIFGFNPVTGKVTSASGQSFELTGEDPDGALVARVIRTQASPPGSYEEMGRSLDEGLTWTSLNLEKTLVWPLGTDGNGNLVMVQEDEATLKFRVLPRGGRGGGGRAWEPRLEGQPIGQPGSSASTVPQNWSVAGDGRLMYHINNGGLWRSVTPLTP